MPLIQAFTEIGLDSSELLSSALANGEIITIPAARALAIAQLANEKKILVIAPSSRVANELANELRAYRESTESAEGASDNKSHTSVIELPAWETLPFEKLSPKADTIAARARALHLMRENSQSIVVSSLRAVLAPINKEFAIRDYKEIEVGSEISPESLLAELVALGYENCDLVEKRGEFAVRGGLIDLFCTDAAHPMRIDFFGDEIDEMHYFTVADQRTFEPVVGKTTIYPAREIFLTPEIKNKAALLATKYNSLAPMLEKISQGILVEGAESLTPLLCDELVDFSQYLESESLIVLIDEPRIRSRSLDLLKTNEEFLDATWSNLAWSKSTNTEIIESKLPVDLRGVLESFNFLSLDSFLEISSDRSIESISINSYESDEAETIAPALNDFADLTSHEIYRGNFDKALADVENWLSHEYLVVFSAVGKGTLTRFRELLRTHDIPERWVPQVNSALTRNLVYLVQSPIEHGFISHSHKIVLLSEKDISGERSGEKDKDRMPSRRKKAIDPLSLKPGDYVVHEQHGVGRFIELINRNVGGISREYLVIEYAASKRGQPGDRLYLPTDTLDQLTKYVGGESPALHKIGGSDWQNTKKRARKAVKEIAAELIQLYASRMSAPGYAFSPDTPWQRELEEAFPYVETIDQLSTIEEVKADMEKPHPMDRVICGDVGYGKTEIAIRAAFKAVQDGKQVAVLVPTTLLVAQHLSTFVNRYAGFPVNVAGLSRFNTDKESKEILQGVEKGLVDIVIGTHRLLSKDVTFKDLGLIIIDEEQRFGVEHKEELKKARTNVDVLSMSATPIPRTLEMAITGIREMSNITTPPEERHPVLTYVGPYDEKQVAAAINRELLRDGQVFFVHNRVESIDSVALRIHELVPQARIRVAHGKMSENELESVIQGFWEREFDVLVTTTIVESGIDIPNANTLIVDRADNFGLSQLHQLRGRVGRSRERAYSYFLYSPDKPLTEVAHDRLTTIATNSELGSGMHVALKDLEIRGAGNLLGGQQSGHIAEVGFDLYMRMVGEAVEDFKTGIVTSETVEKITECKVEIPVDAHLPTTYIDSERLRLDIYRRIADAKDNESISLIAEEMVDRFGEIPASGHNLLDVARLRLRAKKFGIKELIATGKHLRISPVTLPESATLRLTRLYPGSIIKPSVATILVAKAEKAKWEEGKQDDAVEAKSGREYLDWVVALFDSIFTQNLQK
jgi:transcription-repair coupling factor (superfamily II helicase)